jgi:hypothetical protein
MIRLVEAGYRSLQTGVNSGTELIDGRTPRRCLSWPGGIEANNDVEPPTSGSAVLCLSVVDRAQRLWNTCR